MGWYWDGEELQKGGRIRFGLGITIRSIIMFARLREILRHPRGGFLGMTSNVTLSGAKSLLGCHVNNFMLPIIIAKSPRLGFEPDFLGRLCRFWFLRC